MWEKEKMLVTSIFSFSHNVFFPFNPFPQDKVVDQSNLKALADWKIIVTQKLKFGFETVEKIVGKGGSASPQHFFLSKMF